MSSKSFSPSKIGATLKGLTTNSATPTILAAVLIGSVVATSAKGVDTPTLDNDPRLKLLGNEYAGQVVWIKGTTISGAPYSTHGLLVSPTEVILAGHRTPSAGSLARINFVGSGVNQDTSPGIVVSASSWARHPDYVSNDKTRPDIGKIILNSPLPFTGSSTFDNVIHGRKYNLISFGPIRTITTGSTFTGDIRGWKMDSVGLVDSSADADLYTSFLPDASQEYAISGDSSAILFDPISGNAIGLISYGSDQLNHALMFNNPEVLSFVVPEPLTLTTLVGASVVLLARKRR